MALANTTIKLQPLDINANKSVKDFLRDKLRTWIPEEVEKQLQADVEATTVSVSMSKAVTKNLG